MMYVTQIIAVALNGDSGDSEKLIACQKKLSERLKISVIRPLNEGAESLLPAIREFFQHDHAKK